MKRAIVAALAGLATTQALLYVGLAAAYWLYDHAWGPLGVALGIVFGFGAVLAGTGTAYHKLRSPKGRWLESAVPVPVALAGIALALPVFSYGRALYPITVCETTPERLVADAARCDILCTEGWSRKNTPIAKYTVTSGKGTSAATHTHHVQALTPATPDGRYLVWFEGEAPDRARCVWWDRTNPADEAARRHPLGHPQAIVGEWVPDADPAIRWFRTKVAIFALVVNLAALIAAAKLGRKELRGG